MSKTPHYRNAPITEAIFDLRVTLPASTAIADLEAAYDRLGGSFPDMKIRKESTLRLETTGESWGGGFSSKPVKVLFQDEQGKRVVQFGLDGFTFNMLKPYSNWEDFLEQARARWKTYIEVAKPVNIKRLALRYVNRIEIPLPLKNFNEYLLTIPEIAGGLPQGLAAFFMRLVIPHEDKQMQANIIQTMHDATEEGKLPLLFDIDVYREILIEPDSPDLWDIMQKLREYKNRVFRESLTEKCKELFE